MTDVEITWTNNDDSPDGGIDVERSTDGFSTITTVASGLSTSTTSYTDTTTSAGTTYDYRVKRYSDHSTEYSGTSTITTIAAPSTPQNVSLTVDSNDQITITWDEPSDWGGETGDYDVLRGTVSGSYTKVADVAYGTNTYSDSGLLDGERYFYAVEAENSAGSTDSAEVDGITLLPPPTDLSVSNIGPDSADLGWTNQEDNATEKRVYMRETGEPSGMSFDGSTDHVITEENGPSGDPPVTLSVWAKADTTNQKEWTGIFSLGTDQDANTTFTITTGTNGNNIEVHTWGNSTASVALDDTNWHHYVGVNTGNGEQRFYYDGNLVGSMSNTLNIPSEPLVIGARKSSLEDNDNQRWDGDIANAIEYDRALSDSEITDLYNGNPPSNGLVGYWPLDINRSGTTPDLSPQSNDGTVNGATLTGPTVSLDQTLSASANTVSLSGLLNGEEYEAYLHTLTDHNEVRDN